MKKVFIVIVILILLIIIGQKKEWFDINNIIGTSSVANEESLIGIWTLNKTIRESDYSISEAAIEFRNDGTCYFAEKIKRDTGSAMDLRYQGKCYLNKFKNKLKLETDDSVVFKWVKYKNDGNNLTLGQYEFIKVN